MRPITTLLLLLLLTAPATAQHAIVGTTLQSTDTTANSVLVGCTPGSTTCTGGVKAGPVSASGVVTSTAGAITATASGGGGVTLIRSGAASDEKNWVLRNSAPGVTDFAITSCNDASNSCTNAFTIARTGATPTLITLAANTSVTGTLTPSGAIVGANGSAGTPTYGFSGAASGMYLSGSTLSFSSGGVLTMRSQGPGVVDLPSTARGTGVVTGPNFSIGRNTSGSQAAGALDIVSKAAVDNWIWPDSTGVLRISTGGPPTENGSTSDTSGTVIGTQTSSLDTKILLRRRTDNARMLRTLLRAPVYDFQYRSGAYNGETFTGVVTDFTPELGMDPDEAHPTGRSLNPVNATGYTIGAIKALESRLRELEATVAALKAALDQQAHD